MIAAPLNLLDISPLNPRATDPTDDQVAAMAASIRSVGLISPLVGYAGDDGRWQIVAGGVRLRALRLLSEQNPVVWPADRPVPVILIEQDHAYRIGGTAQAAVTPLTPADEAELYRKMRDGGDGVDDIAATFAQRPRYVKQRLALADLPPPVFTALRDGACPLSVAEALTIDPDQADALWTRLAHIAATDPAQAIRNIRHEANVLDRHSHQMRTLEQVGRERFIAAGGVIEENLFGDNLRLTNPDALNIALAELKEETAAAMAHAAGFTRWCIIGQYEHVDPRINPTYDSDDIMAARYEELMDIDRDLTDAEGAEVQAIQTRANTPIYTDDQRRLGTLLIRDTYDGLTLATYAAIDDDQQAEAITLGLIDPPRPRQEAAPGGPATDGAAAEGAEEDGGPWPAALIADLGNLPLDIAADQIADKFELALWLIAWNASRPRWRGVMGLSATLAARSNLIAMDSATSGWIPDDSARPVSLNDFMARGKPHRNRVLAGLAAMTVQQHALPDIAPQLDLDIRAHWTPDAEFFARLKKDHLIAIAADLGAETYIPQTMKKGELVDGLAAIFATPPESIAATVAAWLPPPLRRTDETAI